MIYFGIYSFFAETKESLESMEVEFISTVKSNYFFKNHNFYVEKVQVGKDQEKAQSEKDSHSKNRGGKKPK